MARKRQRKTHPKATKRFNTRRSPKNGKKTATTHPKSAHSSTPELRLVQPTTGIDLGQSESVRDRPGDPDVLVLIATLDEFEMISNILPLQRKTSTGHNTKHCEHHYPYTTSSGQTYNMQVMVLGDQGELLASSVMMNALYSRIESPLVVASVGISMSLNSDVKLGDVVFADSIDRYLERARVEDRWRPDADRQKDPPTHYDLKFSGTGAHALQDEVDTLKFFAHDPSSLQHTAMEQWQTTCAAELEASIGEMLHTPQVKQKIRTKPKHHVGLMLSGPLLVDSHLFKEKLRSEEGRHALALDMESGGLVTSTKWIKSKQRPELSLVVRGASDLGDGSKKADDSGAYGIPPEAYRRVAMRNAYRALLMLCESGWLLDHKTPAPTR